MTDTAKTAPAQRYCPICDEVNDHPQPYKTDDDRWFCGACWFKTGQAIEMKTRTEETPP